MRKLKRPVLAEGEVTGHAHVAVGEDVEVWAPEQHELPLRTLVAPKGAKVVHEEHGAVELSPGQYTVGRVREYDPLLEEERRVLD